MSNVLEFLAEPDLELLQEIANDLDDVLSPIAHDNKAEDLDYIRKAQKELEEKYGKIIYKRFGTDTSQIHFNNGIANAIDCIVTAYASFQSLLEDDLETPEDIRKEAKEILGEYLLFPDPTDPESFVEADEV